MDIKKINMKVTIYHALAQLSVAVVFVVSINTAYAANYLYIANTPINVQKIGLVKASGLSWRCQKKLCYIRGPWPSPGVTACKALAAKVGKVSSYGRTGSMLNKNQLAQCNSAITNSGKAIRTSVVNSKANANFAVAQNTAVLANQQKMVLLNNQAFVLKEAFAPKRTNPDKGKSDIPTGPDPTLSPVNLVHTLDPGTGRFEQDFSRNIRWQEVLIRDHSAPHVLYYYPQEYLLQRETNSGYKLKFSYRYLDDSEPQQDLVKMNFTLSPRYLPGDTALLKRLAGKAFKASNKKSLELQPLAIDSAKVVFSGLQGYITDDKIRILNSPHRVGDEIRVEASMSESVKEEIVASLRNMGLAGEIIFTSKNIEFPVPFTISFSDYSGPWVTDIRTLNGDNSARNFSPFPLAVKGVVAYVSGKSGHIERHYKSLAQVDVMAPNAIRNSDTPYASLFQNKGTILATWLDFDVDSACEDCLNKIEKDILTDPSITSKSALPIEVIPTVFEQFSLFKILVEVESQYFNSASDYTENKRFTLRSNQTSAVTNLYLDRDAQGESIPFKYRVKPIRLDGQDADFSAWRDGDSAMDITITAGDIRPLVPESKESETTTESSDMLSEPLDETSSDETSSDETAIDETIAEETETEVMEP